MKSFRVSNFRLFGSEGTEVKFKPVTVLTGANSSGKSSFVKAMVVFGHYLDSLLNDYRRDGSYNPISRKLDFSVDSKLKMKGFSRVANRFLSKDTPMTFSMELFPPISCYGGYNVSYSFVADDPENALDQGTLQSISVDIEGEQTLRIESIKEVKKNEKGEDTETLEFKITQFNQNRLISDFIAFCRYCVLPSHIIKNSFDDYGGSDPDYCNDNGTFSSEKAAETILGK